MMGSQAWWKKYPKILTLVWGLVFYWKLDWKCFWQLNIDRPNSIFEFFTLGPPDTSWYALAVIWSNKFCNPLWTFCCVPPLWTFHEFPDYTQHIGLSPFDLKLLCRACLSLNSFGFSAKLFFMKYNNMTSCCIVFSFERDSFCFLQLHQDPLQVSKKSTKF